MSVGAEDLDRLVAASDEKLCVETAGMEVAGGRDQRTVAGDGDAVTRRK